ncbi:MAG: NADPH-dependent 7-cyano-7-deazaguanine reductase QueF [Pseudomonadales bacterium]
MNNSEQREQHLLKESPLGDHTAYVNHYDPSQLFPIERAINWQKRGVERAELPFMHSDSAVDIWNGYEISWLNPKGKPVVRIAQFRIDARSSHIIESKSFKLYLNSFNLSAFDSEQAVIAQMEADLSRAAGGAVEVLFYHPDNLPAIGRFEGRCIDECDVEITQYTPDVSLLGSESAQHVEETLYSHLLKSNCPVTGQPDWASISIAYTGAKIDEAGLLKYLVSYREHGDFHEQCVENIFMDIWQQCQPEALTVYARYIRRGGLDINPYRSSLSHSAENTRLSRQ